MHSLWGGDLDNISQRVRVDMMLSERLTGAGNVKAGDVIAMYGVIVHLPS